MHSSRTCLSICLAALCYWAGAGDTTSFQTGSGYGPDIDIQSDLVMVYGVDGSFAERAQSWKDNGYAVGTMTGISWGEYSDYYVVDGSLKKDEIQTDVDGKVFMHGNSETVGYNVPSPAYIEYIKQRINPAIDWGVESVFLEEPEFWARTGWSAAFKAEWERFYGEPWRAPDSSPDAQWRASLLKYELYFHALKEVFAHADSRAKALGREVECHVPTHSLLNYAHWRIVSPMSHLIDIPELDGYIAQVWTGTARTPNVYQGERRERTFETAFLEYGQMAAMTRPTGKKVWFLADPIEDNPRYSWKNYRKNYEDTILASLLWPEVSRFEVMPWPGRIFRGQYPVEDGKPDGPREGMPPDYATELLTVINALNDMDQPEIDWHGATGRIGVVVSDTLMFQRAEPTPSDPHLGVIYGLAMPLVKAGVPVNCVQLENVLHPATLEAVDVLLMTYEGQKPLKAAYHDALAAWVREGGRLLFFDAGTDPYHDVRAWWNEEGTNGAKAYGDLFTKLGVDASVTAPQTVGDGTVRIMGQNPSAVADDPKGAEAIRSAVSDALAEIGVTLTEQPFFDLRRGPYRIVRNLEESAGAGPLHLTGPFINLFDPALDVLEELTLEPGEGALLRVVDYGAHDEVAVLAASGRVEREETRDFLTEIVVRGPAGIPGKMRVACPRDPQFLSLEGDVTETFRTAWDPSSRSVEIWFEHRAEPLLFRIAPGPR